MKMYLVSEKDTLIRNSGFVLLTTGSYDEAFEKAEVGHFIHEVTLVDTFAVVNAGKMARKVT